MAGSDSVDYVVMPRPWEPSEVVGRWVADRESEGWAGVGVGDHWFIEGSGGCANVFVQLGHAAASTTSIRLSTAFANNLFRSPVELAQAALTMQLLSDGRFELGIGAGWAETELAGAGLAFPDPAVRIRRLREAVRIVRDLLHGACRFSGEFYDVDLPATGPPVSVPPPISAALGGLVGMRTIGPLVDRIELVTWGAAFQDKMGRTSRADLQRLIDVAREANPTAPITLALYVAPGTGPDVDHLRSAYEASCFHGLAGPADRVADAVRGFSDLEIDRINILPPVGGVAELAAHLLKPNH